jgi:hypothetical protein
MGWLRKRAKAVKKGFKKFKKKFNLKKALKIAAIIGAAIVTGGAAVGAFTGGTATGFGGWMMNAGNAILNFNVAGVPVGKVFTPFKMVGTGLGRGARVVTDFTGITEAGNVGNVTNANQAGEILKRSGMSEAEIARLTQEGEVIAAAQDYVTTYGGSGTYTMTDFENTKLANIGQGTVTTASTTDAATGFFDTSAGEAVAAVGTRVAGDVASGYVASLLAGDPQQRGTMMPGEEEQGVYLDPVSYTYYNADVDINKAYQEMTYGTADLSYLRQGLFSQQPIGVT